MVKIRLQKTKKTNPREKGFTLVELVVVISIFAIMTTVSVLNYNDYITSIERLNIAQDIALTTRQAQVYGISASVRDIGGDLFDDAGVAEDFFDNTTGIADVTKNKSIRGIHFSLDDPTIVLYEDTTYPSNFFYNTGSDRIIDEREIISNRISFEYFYLCNGTTCNKETTGVVDVAFQRPYPDAIINYRSSVGSSTGITYTYVAIVLSDQEGAQVNEYIEVYSIGNITVKSNHVES